MIEIGPHRLTNLSVEDDQVNKLFADGRKARIFYSDPPWGDGNVKFWETKAKKDTGRPIKPMTYGALLSSIFGLIERHVSDHVFLETGLRFEEMNRVLMERLGLRNYERVTLDYRAGGKVYENVLLYGSFTGGRADIKRFEHWSGISIPHAAVKTFAVPGEIVFDPCCGMGYSAQAAIDNGMEFRGNELNEVRLQKTITRLEHQ